MIKLDDDLLKELGLDGLPPEEKRKLLAHIYETLEMRVGMKLAEQMSDAQLTEFEQFIDRNDETGALAWLETNFPNYKDVVSQEFDRLKLEVGQAAPQILAAAQANAAMPSAAGAQTADPNDPTQMPPQMPQQPPAGMGNPGMPGAPGVPQGPAAPGPQGY